MCLDKWIAVFLLAGGLAAVGEQPFHTPGQDLDGLTQTNAPEAGLPHVLLNGDSISIGCTKADSQRQAERVAAAVPKSLTLRPPTLADIRYGNHERHVMDLWQATSDSPAPLVFVIHGGGWSSGRKEWVDRFVDVDALLQAGISVAAVNYRYTTQAGEMNPPVKAPLVDAARALQFLRAHAAEWNLDSERIGAAGASAGACSSLWLAYHDDLADPESEDAVSRESTRLWCAAVINAQTSLDPKQMKEWIPNSRYGGHAFGLKNFAEFLTEREHILPWIAEYSPYANVSADDPPVYLFYKTPPAPGLDQRDPTHSANFGVRLKEHCEALGISCELVYPGLDNPNHESPTDYLIAMLKNKRR